MPDVVKKLSVMVLKKSERPNWIDKYDTLITMFGTHTAIDSRDDWTEWPEVINFLQNLKTITIDDIQHLKGNKYQPSQVYSPTWYLMEWLSKAGSRMVGNGKK